MVSTFLSLLQSVLWCEAFTYLTDLCLDRDTSKIDKFEEMFVDATSFNSPIGNWDISSAETMAGMFNGASSFNQNLCNWRDSFPYGSETSEDIFANSGCTFQDEPQRSNSNGGPFCAYDCSPTVRSGSGFGMTFDFVVHLFMSIVVFSFVN